ncbi:hypothetical protein H0H93_000645 [Arthromyces matolae]|nr:hypothetical protein H0H93_000645 [Arthromyces matolae]
MAGSGQDLTANMEAQFSANRQLPSGRGHRDAKENERIASHKSDLVRNAQKRARAMATRQRNRALHNNLAAEAQSQRAPNFNPPVSFMPSPAPGITDSVNQQNFPMTPNPPSSPSPAIQSNGFFLHTPHHHLAAAPNSGHRQPLQPTNQVPSAPSAWPFNLDSAPQLTPTGGATLQSTPTGMGPSAYDDGPDVNDDIRSVHDEDEEWTTSQHHQDMNIFDESEEENNDVPQPALSAVIRQVKITPRVKAADRHVVPMAEEEHDLDMNTDEDGDLRAHKPQKLQRRQRPSRGTAHCSSQVRQILNRAYEKLRQQIATSTPFPAPKDETSESRDLRDDPTYDMALQAWDAACDGLHIEMDPKMEYLQRITERFSSYRGRLKEKARACVASNFNFISISSLESPTPEKKQAVIAQNRQLVQAIHDTFWNKDPHNSNVSPDNPLYGNTIIQKMINTSVPLQTIALVLSLVECAIDEWKSGQPKNVNFDANTYRPVYLRHLKVLSAWAAFSEKEPVNLTLQLQETLLRNARICIAAEEDEEEVGVPATDTNALMAMFRANQPGSGVV